MKRKILTSVIIFLLLAVAGILIVVCTSHEQDPADIDYRYYTENVIIITHDSGYILGHISSNAFKPVSGPYDRVIPYYADRDAVSAVVVNDGLRGYILSETGEVILEPQFLYAWLDNGENGLAACVNTEGKLGFVNLLTKETVIPFQYDFNKEILCPNDQPLYDFVFCNGVCIVPDKDGNLGLINENGDLVLPIEYSDIINWRDADAPVIVLESRADEEGTCLYTMCDRDFRVQESPAYDSLDMVMSYDCSIDENRLMGYIVSRDGLYGMLDSSWKPILPLKYDNIYALDSYDNNAVDGVVAIKDYVPQLYSYSGVLLNDFYSENHYAYDEESDDYIECPGFAPLQEPFAEQASGYIRYCLDGAYGVIDGTKRVVIPAKYEKVEYLGHGNFLCVLHGINYLINDKR